MATRAPTLDLTLDLPGASPAFSVVVLGDSASAGHGLRDPDQTYARRVARHLAAGERAVSLRCAAFDGATTADVIDAQLPRFATADLAVVGVGANDALHGRSLRRVAADTRRLLAALRRRVPDGRLVLLSCPDLGAATGVPRVLRPVVGRRCRAVATVQQGVADAAGVQTLPVDRTRLVPEVFGTDGFHPGPIGHELLARRLIDEHLARVGLP